MFGHNTALTQHNIILRNSATRCGENKLEAFDPMGGIPMNSFRIIDKLIKDTDFVSKVLERDSEPVFRTNLAQFEDLSFAIGDAVHAMRIVRQECLELLGYCVPTMNYQSGVASDFDPVSSTHEQIVFEDATNEQQEEAVPPFVDNTRTLMDKTDVSLSDFFSRPIKIDSFDWQVLTTVNRTINPWTLFFSNPRVQNRLTNYELLRCKLKLKFLVNGNPFYFGRLLMVYTPMITYDALYQPMTVTGDFVLGTQKPHMMLNPTCSEGGEMTLPFFWHLNYLSITSKQWEHMGSIQMVDLNVLQHANGDTAPVTVSVMAWAEDVEVSMLTSVDIPAMSPQSGVSSEVEEADTKGKISKPATAWSKKVAMLGVIPSLKPFAMATSMMLQGAGMMAKAMGYSRPLPTIAPTTMIQRNTASMATCNSVDTAVKLTVDDKQELTIDNRIAGIDPGDELSIRSIASREAWLTNFGWSGTDNPEDLLFNIRLNPGGFFMTNGNATYMTPLALATLPFEYWTGTLKFRFQFVVSAYHRGRVRLSFDPKYQESTEYNTNYNHIVDITEKSDFTVEIGMAQNRNLLRVLHPDSSPYSDFYSQGAFINANNECNGVLSVYVMNELTSPSNVVPITSVNVYVSAGDDFEVFVPGNYHSQYVLQPQSMTVSPEAGNCEQDGSTVLCVGTTNSDNLNKVYIGETILSLRTLLRRYVLHESLVGPGVAAYYNLEFTRVAFPYYRGNIPNAIHQTISVTPYNYCNTTLLNLLVTCFSGHRGSIRYKYIPNFDVDSNTKLYIEVERQLPELSSATNTDTVVPFNNNLSQAAWIQVTSQGQAAIGAQKPGAFGMAFQNTRANENLEFEVPFYSHARFLPGKHMDYTSESPLDMYSGINGAVLCRTDLRTRVNSYVSIGEDFQVYFYTGPPPLYFEPVPPGPVA